MAKNTLCPIRDIKGWRNYNKCPYTKSLFSKAGVSDILHTSGRKERFFNALQKNVGRDGYLTKDAMKKTLGEFKYELDSNQFYKLSTAVLPNEAQRFVLKKNNTSISTKVDNQRPASGEKISNNPSVKSFSATNEKRAGIICPARVARFAPKNEDGRDGNSEKSSFFHAMRTTIRKNN